jgi:hypothetical protein
MGAQMASIFAVLLVVHGLIHLLGFAKAFGFADLPQLTQPISPFLGVLWLLAALLFLATAAALLFRPRGWWAVGLCAVVLSMVLVAGAGTDAKAGAFANLVVLVGVVFGFLAQGPLSLRAAYERDLRLNLAHEEPSERLTDADISNLPAPVQRYLRTAGVVGQPRVRNFFVRVRGRIRNGPDAPWIALSAEQHNFIAPAARLFYLTGSMFAVPVQGYHRYVGPAATMQIKAAALVPVVDVSGSEMNQGETVTLFNDMCVMAPATLISRSIAWEPVDAHTTRATFTNAGQTIHAELSFNDAGELTNFLSDDRYLADGKTIKKVRWSTPISGYRTFGPFRLASAGEGHWHEPEGEYAYIQLTIEDVRYNIARR